MFVLPRGASPVRTNQPSTSHVCSEYEEAWVGFWRRLSCVVIAALVLETFARAAQVPARPVPCTFPASELEWLQRALHGWEQVSREYLRTEPTPLPWIVLFDASCVWHLNPDSHPGSEPVAIPTNLTFAGAAVPVRALGHERTVLLPSGVPLSIEMKASTSLYQNGQSAFFVMAMPSVWQSREVSGPTRAEYLQGVFSHEMTHVRLLVAINRRVRELAVTNDLVYPINDDVIQSEFQRVDGFEAAFNRERDQFYRAALEADPEKRRPLIARGLEMARRRHARYFTGANTVYAELETLFLTLEGVGQWAAYQLTQARAAGKEHEALRLVRDNRRFWSQDEGLALFLLIDATVPGWQSRIFSPTPASPFALLEEALAHR